MGKTSRRRSATRELERETEDLRKKTAMLPFLLIFGAAWLVFGLAAVGTGIARQEGPAVTAGGAICLLGALMLARALVLRRRVLARLKGLKGEKP